MLLTAERTDLAAPAFVAQHAEVFAVFDATTQDSGNVSYGARVGASTRWTWTAIAIRRSPTTGADVRLRPLHGRGGVRARREDRRTHDGVHDGPDRRGAPSLGTEAVASLIAHACERDPRRRFATAAQFYDAWSAVMADISQPARRNLPSITYTIAGLRIRHLLSLSLPPRTACDVTRRIPNASPGGRSATVRRLGERATGGEQER